MTWREYMNMEDFEPVPPRRRDGLCDKVYGMLGTRVTNGHVYGFLF
jgi:hypothetical protein